MRKAEIQRAVKEYGKKEKDCPAVLFLFAEKTGDTRKAKRRFRDTFEPTEGIFSCNYRAKDGMIILTFRMGCGMIKYIISIV